MAINYLDVCNPKKPTTVVYCSKESEIPKVKHWAIIETRTGSEAGYDRGDPSHPPHSIISGMSLTWIKMFGRLRS